MRVVNDLDKSHIRGMMEMRAEMEEIEKRMMEMYIDNSSKSVKRNKWGIAGGECEVLLG